MGVRLRGYGGYILLELKQNRGGAIQVGALTYLMESSTERDVGFRIGLYQAVGAIGSVLGPVLGSWLFALGVDTGLMGGGRSGYWVDGWRAIGFLMSLTVFAAGTGGYQLPFYALPILLFPCWCIAVAVYLSRRRGTNSADDRLLPLAASDQLAAPAALVPPPEQQVAFIGFFNKWVLLLLCMDSFYLGAFWSYFSPVLEPFLEGTLHVPKAHVGYVFAMCAVGYCVGTGSVGLLTSARPQYVSMLLFSHVLLLVAGFVLNARSVWRVVAGLFVLGVGDGFGIVPLAPIMCSSDDNLQLVARQHMASHQLLCPRGEVAGRAGTNTSSQGIQCKGFSHGESVLEAEGSKRKSMTGAQALGVVPNVGLVVKRWLEWLEGRRLGGGEMARATRGAGVNWLQAHGSSAPAVRMQRGDQQTGCGVMPGRRWVALGCGGCVRGGVGPDLMCRGWASSLRIGFGAAGEQWGGPQRRLGDGEMARAAQGAEVKWLQRHGSFVPAVQMQRGSEMSRLQRHNNIAPAERFQQGTGLVVQGWLWQLQGTKASLRRPGEAG
ncbi:hypothetical protein CYMTET_37747 [Cymbomonas tetramitiformis]|uniref:Uncharacterized protein n=1 Tax=Cymbomonas tetramitiformis TaxID=36881 RepID=A0AAE0F5X6_9CHLO|nr:hypothetical protein CYMTET_37747 [Cymbomonas tetramitiformis]